MMCIMSRLIFFVLVVFGMNVLFVNYEVVRFVFWIFVLFICELSIGFNLVRND